MPRSLRRSALFALAFALAGTPLVAQAPGYPPIDTRQIFAEFHAEVLGELNEINAEWGEAWASDDSEALLDLYWDKAVVIPPGGSTPLRGQRAIHTWFEEHKAEFGAVEAFMLDFDASGGMAVVIGNYLLLNPGNASTLSAGPLMTVYLLRGRTWKIRSQVFTGG